MSKLFYGRFKHPEMKGRKFQNARYFNEVDPKATDVMIDGDWPNIEAAYKAAGVKVTKAKPEAYLAESEKEAAVAAPSQEPAVQQPRP
jgi:hypothetical protein